MSGETGTRAFAPFEWLVALRYLRARRREGFISVIAGFSFIGIMLGVATLIIVMAVMNGFRQELFNKMLGLNGHVVVHSLGNFADFDDVAARIRGVPGVKLALPLVEGQVMISRTMPTIIVAAAIIRPGSGVKSTVISMRLPRGRTPTPVERRLQARSATGKGSR